MKELTKNYVKELRQNSSDAEKYLWYFLRAKRLAGSDLLISTYGQN